MHVGLGLRQICTFQVVPHCSKFSDGFLNKGSLVVAFRLKSMAVIIFASNESWGWIYEPRNCGVWYDIKKKTNVLCVEFTAR